MNRVGKLGWKERDTPKAFSDIRNGRYKGKKKCEKKYSTRMELKGVKMARAQEVYQVIAIQESREAEKKPDN